MFTLYTVQTFMRYSQNINAYFDNAKHNIACSEDNEQELIPGNFHD